MLTIANYRFEEASPAQLTNGEHCVQWKFHRKFHGFDSVEFSRESPRFCLRGNSTESSTNLFRAFWILPEIVSLQTFLKWMLNLDETSKNFGEFNNIIEWSIVLHPFAIASFNLAAFQCLSQDNLKHPNSYFPLSALWVHNVGDQPSLWNNDTLCSLSPIILNKEFWNHFLYLYKRNDKA